MTVRPERAAAASAAASRRSSRSAPAVSRSDRDPDRRGSARTRTSRASASTRMSSRRSPRASPSTASSSRSSSPRRSTATSSSPASGACAPPSWPASSAIPAVVRQLADREQLELALVENLQRADLDPIEEADAYRQLIDEFGLTQDEVAARVGRARSTVANTLRLLDLAPGVQAAVADGRLTEGHGRALGGLPAELQDRVLDSVLGQELSRPPDRGARPPPARAEARAGGRAGAAARSRPRARRGGPPPMRSAPR